MDGAAPGRGRDGLTRRARALWPLLILAFLMFACVPATGGAASASPERSADIKRSKLDIVYSGLADADYFKPTSRELLVAALEAIKGLAKANGGNADVATPEFSGETASVIADFKAFAAAASTIAARNPQLSADRIADAAVNAMLAVKADCHTYYVKGRTAAARPLAAPDAGPAADRAGLQYELLAGGVGYITWHEFVQDGTYSITDEVRKALDALLARGAKSWLFDLRGNRGGDPPQAMYSWFLNGEPAIEFHFRTGSGGVQPAKKELRLPDAYQLPIAIAIDHAAGSSPEFFTLALKENARATVVGERSAGCLGSFLLTALPDGSQLAITSMVATGAVTGAAYNGAGIPPDVPTAPADAVDTAARLLRDQVARGKVSP
ncbi:MAG: S41 family peptidase [Chloroflexota bacterium]|nr:S41 family peptidase [Chloroflexota bacterium]